MMLSGLASCRQAEKTIVQTGKTINLIVGSNLIICLLYPFNLYPFTSIAAATFSKASRINSSLYGAYPSTSPGACRNCWV